jgi:hypothetical protein
MAKADRLERMDVRRAELEAEYHEALLAALHIAADGTWGLFDHKPDRAARARTAPVLAELTALADEIDELRALLGLNPFTLHHDFLAARGPVAPNEVGEPRQAQAWLGRLARAKWDDPS